MGGTPCITIVGCKITNKRTKSKISRCIYMNVPIVFIFLRGCFSFRELSAFSRPCNTQKLWFQSTSMVVFHQFRVSHQELWHRTVSCGVFPSWQSRRHRAIWLDASCSHTYADIPHKGRNGDGQQESPPVSQKHETIGIINSQFLGSLTSSCRGTINYNCCFHFFYKNMAKE